MTYRTRTYSSSYITPCETYEPHGRYPDQSRSPVGSIMCTEPGPVSSIFTVENEFVTPADTWVELSDSCNSSNEMCSNCTRECARFMMTFGGDCSVSGEDQDNGWSPRLHKCYTCCAQKNCSDVCDEYHNIHCHPVGCSTGNLVEFQLRPRFKDNEFLCHVTPVTNQKLMEIEYTVMHYYETLVKKSFIMYGNDVWRKTGKQSHSEGMVQIDLDSKLDKIPDFVKGSINTRNFSFGMHQSEGISVQSTFITGQMALIRPRKPFGMTATMFGQKSCEDDVLKDTVVVSDSDDPYTPIPDYIGLNHSDSTYTVYHKKELTSIRLGVDQHSSILSYLYPPAVLRPGTLSGSIVHNTSHWILTTQGFIKTCPGIINLNISLPEYPHRPLYQYAVAIKCPEMFKLTFYIPNGDKPESDKELIVAVRDKTTTYHLNLYKPAAKVVVVTEEKSKQGHRSIESPLPAISEPPHFSVPFIASVCGCILLLLFVAAFGIAIKFGQPEGDVLRFQLCQLFVMISYVTFNFIYAIFVSMTVFVFIIIAVNSDTASFLKNYHQQRSVKSAYSHLVLDNMERHLQAEIYRQNKLAKHTMSQCEKQMKIVVEDLNQLRREVEEETINRLDRQNVKSLMNVHMKDVLKKFTDNLSVLMERYNIYVKHIQKSFVTNIQETYNSVQKNKWMKGADFLHKTVKNLRDLTGATTKPFMDWAGFQTDLSQVSIGANMPLPRLPLFDDILNINVHPGTRSSKPTRVISPEQTNIQTHNMWMYKDSTAFMKNESSNQDDKVVTMETESWNMGSYYLFFWVMMFIDIVWFFHRMLKALGVGQLLLYGYPIFVDIRDKTDETQPSTDDLSSRKLCKSGICSGFKEFTFKVLSSMFVPKVIATIFVCMVVYLISMATHHFVNRETFSYLGYYNNMNDLLWLHEKYINNRIDAHANRINTLEYPAYQELMNDYIRHHHYLFSMQEKQWREIGSAHSQFYCDYLKKIDVNAVCEPDGPIRFDNLQITACHFKRVIPKAYKRYSGSDSRVAEFQMDAFLTRIRQLISDTCYIILIYLSTVVIKELLGTVIWLYMKRSGLINLRIIYEADEPPPPKQVS
ncbi:hypothetical protein KUTeg_011803 [Tegillarca granosa]|uniref:Uncharacterized protein n=1 Tax=Tegillarca granosa TaxID=220873 RepID=A0ABQ9EXP5_TEGGR|nr:hypothetical protein KUTeg_011803 [Tegillarca granosa]